MTDELPKYLNFLKQKVTDNSRENDAFSIYIRVDMNFKNSTSFDGFNIKYDKDGTPITLTEENIREKFPLKYNNLKTQLKSRYQKCKMDKPFHAIMAKIKSNDKLFHFRKLDIVKEKSCVMGFYSTNIWQELDKFYDRSNPAQNPGQLKLSFKIIAK